MRRLLITIVACAYPLLAAAGPKEDAEAVLQKFIATFNAATSLDEIVGLFAPDAQFWGTNSPEMEVGPDAIRKYFAESFSRRSTAPATASVVSSTTMVASDNLVLISGRWQVAGGANVSQNRFSAIVANRGGRWLITQFHSSRRPQAK